jgi:hypothetical protein
MRRILVTLALLAAGVSSTATAQARPATTHRARAEAQAFHPDQVIEWNQELLTILTTPAAQPATVHPTRSMAITQLAVYDAVEAIDGRRQLYVWQPRAPRDASPDAAAAAAAHRVLVSLFPGQQAAIDAKLVSSLAELGDVGGRRLADGVAVGEQAASAILAARQDDGSGATPPPYVAQPGAGEYQLTPPAFGPPVFTHWAAVRPFVLRSADQFRPPPPPAIAGARYAADFDEVKALGDVASTTRSADQTDVARFWGAAPVQNVWNQVAQTAGLLDHTLEQNAAMFAVLDTSLADGVIALYDAKYAYHQWRPVTAVQAGDADGNPNTAGDPAWTPLAATAPDPSYVGAHAEISASAATALRAVLHSDRLEFSLSNPSLPTIVRPFHRLSQASDEAALSRIYAGQHFRFDEDAGQALGSAVAGEVAAGVLGEPDHDHADQDRS